MNEHNVNRRKSLEIDELEFSVSCSVFEVDRKEEMMWLCVIGELDPERMGSGIQYGDSTLRRLHQQQPQGNSCKC